MSANCLFFEQDKSMNLGLILLCSYFGGILGALQKVVKKSRCKRKAVPRHFYRGNALAMVFIMTAISSKALF